MKTERHEDYWLTTQRFGTRLLLCEGKTRKDSVRGMYKMLADRWEEPQAIMRQEMRND